MFESKRSVVSEVEKQPSASQQHHHRINKIQPQLDRYLSFLIIAPCITPCGSSLSVSKNCIHNFDIAVVKHMTKHDWRAEDSVWAQALGSPGKHTGGIGQWLGKWHVRQLVALLWECPHHQFLLSAPTFQESHSFSTQHCPLGIKCFTIEKESLFHINIRKSNSNHNNDRHEKRCDSLGYEHWFISTFLMVSLLKISHMFTVKYNHKQTHLSSNFPHVSPSQFYIIF